MITLAILFSQSAISLVHDCSISINQYRNTIMKYMHWLSDLSTLDQVKVLSIRQQAITWTNDDFRSSEYI